jgi:ER membrane protein complex subunit 8/9
MSSILQPVAYIKIILHSAKYPSSPVGGYIIGDVKSNGEFVVNDVVPVCHRNPCGPMLEICAEMVERLYGPKLKIIGYYYANENMKSPRAAYISQLVGGIKQNTSGPCLLLEVQQDLLSETDRLALKVHLRHNSLILVYLFHNCCSSITLAELFFQNIYDAGYEQRGGS